MPGFPSAQPHLALNGLALFGLELTVVCAFQPPPVFSPSPRCLPGAGGASGAERGSQCGWENCEVAIIQTREGGTQICILWGLGEL